MRLFAGIRPDREFRNALSLLQERLRSAGVTGRYYDPADLHMTLAFIGEWPDDVTPVLPPVETPFSITLPRRFPGSKGALGGNRALGGTGTAGGTGAAESGARGRSLRSEAVQTAYHADPEARGAGRGESFRNRRSAGVHDRGRGMPLPFRTGRERNALHGDRKYHERI